MVSPVTGRGGKRKLRSSVGELLGDAHCIIERTAVNRIHPNGLKIARRALQNHAGAFTGRGNFFAGKANIVAGDLGPGQNVGVGAGSQQ